MEIYHVSGMRGVEKQGFCIKQNHVVFAKNEYAEIRCDIGLSAKFEDMKDYMKIARAMDEIANCMGSSCKSIKEVIFNEPATIILWNDGTKTVVKVEEGEKYDKERGFLMCYLKGIVGNKTLLKELEKWVTDND